MDTSSKYGFSKDVHDYLCHYIDVADTKAGVILGVASGLLGYVLSTPNHSAPEYLSFIAVVLLLIACAICMFIVMPRLYSHGKGMIFWQHINSRGNVDKYIEDVKDLTEEKVEEEFATQNYYLSKILTRKYLGVKWAMIALTIGALAILPLLVL